MEKLNIVCVILSCGNFIASQTVKLIGPDYVKSDSPVHLTCTSDSVPAGQSAEFLVNGQTYRNINYFENKCFIGSALCSHDSCRCSSDAKSYMTSYQPTQMDTNVKFTCSMKFVVDNIRTKEDSIYVQINALPTLQLKDKADCSSTHSLTLSCTLNRDSEAFEYTNWIHILNGQFLRSIEPILVANSSIVYLHSCSFKDLGDYICTARHKTKQQTTVNKTATITILGPPEILNTNILVDGIKTTLSVWAYNNGIPNDTTWLLADEQIPNTSRSIQTTTKKIKSLTFYESLTDFSIMEVNLTLKNAQEGQYSVVLRNAYGETNKTIDLKEVFYSFKLDSLILALASIAFCIIFTTIMVCARKLNVCDNSNSTNRIALYHAAVPTEPVIQMYATTDVQYDDCIIDYLSKNNDLDAPDRDDGRRDKSCHYEEIL